MKHMLKDSQGVVLLLVLCIVALFTVMVVNFSADQGIDMELAYNFRDSLQAQYIARAGIEAAVVILANDDAAYDALDEDWGGFSDYAMAASAFLEGPVFSGTLADESGKIDLNSLILSGEQEFRVLQFKRLFDLLEIEIDDEELNDLVNAMIDWLDPDSETTFGAESDYYESLDSPYVCKNGPMDTPEEILLIKGMKSEYYYGTENYEGIEKYITVGTGGKINLNTASDTVLMTISELFSQDVVESIKGCRPFTQENYECIEGLDLGDTSDEMTWIKKVIDIKSSRFSIEVNGSMPSGAQLNIRAYLQRINNKPQIVYYKIY
ncbi:MAG: type II secretion system minor pseudopilin GspK [Deltaproteobacteria bacterium]|nr:type II secretion system minor pseudopilin GspK [Deltaproteobacteria bacterium]